MVRQVHAGHHSQRREPGACREGNGPDARQEEEEVLEDGCRVRYLPAALLRDLSVVDTPGTNVILERQQRLTEEFVPRADLVLFTMSAGAHARRCPHPSPVTQEPAHSFGHEKEPNASTCAKLTVLTGHVGGPDGGPASRVQTGHSLTARCAS